MEGWIKFHRKILRWEWWEDINVTRLWIYILLRANHEPKKWRGQTVPAGTFITSYPRLSEETRLTVSELRTAMRKLRESGSITCYATNRYQAVTVVNWELYQQEPQRAARKMAGKTPADDMPISSTKKQKKLDKNIEKQEDIVRQRELSNCLAHYERVIRQQAPASAEDVLQAALDGGMEPDCVCAVLDYCAGRSKRNIAYIKAVLENSRRDGILTAAAFLPEPQEGGHSMAGGYPRKKNSFINFKQRGIDVAELNRQALLCRLSQDKQD